MYVRMPKRYDLRWVSESAREESKHGILFPAINPLFRSL
jgi:hypothetical protein